MFLIVLITRGYIEEENLQCNVLPPGKMCTSEPSILENTFYLIELLKINSGQGFPTGHLLSDDEQDDLEKTDLSPHEKNAIRIVSRVFSLILVKSDESIYDPDLSHFLSLVECVRENLKNLCASIFIKYEQPDQRIIDQQTTPDALKEIKFEYHEDKSPLLMGTLIKNLLQGRVDERLKKEFAAEFNNGLRLWDTFYKGFKE